MMPASACHISGPNGVTRRYILYDHLRSQFCFWRNGKTHPIVHCGIDRNIITVLKLLGYGGRVIIIGWWYFVVVPGRKRKTRIES